MDEEKKQNEHVQRVMARLKNEKDRWFVSSKYKTHHRICWGINKYMGVGARRPDYVACDQQRHRPACAPKQSDQHLCFSGF